jgi:hypothetical protein
MYVIERRWTLHEAGRQLQQPLFPRLVRKFLYTELYPDSAVSPDDILEGSLPMIDDKIHVFNSAIVTFYAPSDISGIAGMRREHIRATASWRKGPARYDCILVNSDPGIDGARSFEIARVFLFFSFRRQDKEYPCALVQWFSFVGQEPDEDTGYWLVEPDVNADTSQPHIAVIHLDSIYRAVHLMPAHQNATFIDRTITMHTSLDTFKLFYINKFVDHHSFAVL